MDAYNLYYSIYKAGYPLQELFTQDHVYVIENKATGLYKIGITQNLDQRIRHLSTQSGCEMELVMAIQMEVNYDENAKDIESHIHKYFKPKRVMGEWFKLTPRDLVQIRRAFRSLEGYWLYGKAEY